MLQNMPGTFAVEPVQRLSQLTPEQLVTADCVLLHLASPESMSALRAIRASRPMMPVVALGGSSGAIAHALAGGADDWAPDGDADVVTCVVDSAIRRRQVIEGYEVGRREAERQLAEAQRLAGLGSWQWDIVNDVVTWSEELCRIYGIAPQDFDSSYQGYLSRVHPDDRALVEETVRRSHRTGEPYSFEHRIVRLDGESRLLACRGEVMLGHDGATLRMFGTCQDVTERRMTEEQLSQLALQDHLTGLPNRRLFLDRFAQALARAQRSSGRTALLYLDLDRFKVINDSLGHEVGDRVLLEVARRLGELVRPADTVARLGGDEFVVLAEGLESPEEALAISQRIEDVVAVPCDIGEGTVVVTASVGIALARPGEDPEGLIRDADTAMYRAKELGRGRHEVFGDALRARAVERLDVETTLRAAIDEERLVVHYQPLLDLRSRTIVGAEALVRYRDRDGRLVPPGEFLSVAEESGLIVAVDDWVLAEACRQVVAWREHPATAGLRVAMNISARRLATANLAESLAETLAATGARASEIVLELTESSLIDAGESTLRSLSALKNLGVSLGIDDFGTGYSSLTYLRQFPLDFVKVDQAFVAGLGSDPEDTAIVGAVVNLGRALGLTAIAEGVENEDQLQALAALGCDLAQGYHIARPQSGVELTELLVSARPAASGAQPTRDRPERHSVLSPRRAGRSRRDTRSQRAGWPARPIAEIGPRIREHLDTDRVIRAALSEVRRALRPTQASVWLTRGHGTPRLVHAEPVLRTRSVEAGEGPPPPKEVLTCAARGRPVTNKRLGSHAVPLLVPRSGLVGVLFAQGHLAAEAKELLVAIARETGLALASAHLYEQALAEKEKSEAILARVGDAVVVTDAHGRVTQWNDAAERILRLPSAEALGRHCAEVLCLHRGDQGLVCTAGCPLLAAARDDLLGVEVWRVLPDGRRQPLLAHSEAVRDAEDNIAEVVHSLRDITRLKEADEAKTLFLATASHELKTPLTVIRGFAQALTSGPALEGEDQAEALRAIERRAIELTKIVERLLLSSRIEAGQAEVSPIEADVRAVAAERVSAMAAATGRPVDLEFESDIPPGVVDPDALATVLDHLVDNALKYSPNGIPVVVRLDADDAWVRVAVRDAGIGMDAEQVAHCFEKFWQAESSDVRRFGGTGIGLYIVRSLVEAMGGKVAVESSPDRGSTFLVLLPRAGVPPPTPPEPASPRRSGGQQSIIKEFMRQIGIPDRQP
jgi:diguanylate cyclase (GGDEF)-like protein/PAS domain S-box-containing protein